MCIAIVAQKNAVVSDEELAEGWLRNSHGAGFAFVKKGKVVIKKGFMEFAPFLKAYKSAAKKYSGSSSFLIHMRIRTSGTTDESNTHPFPIKDGAMIHNGILFSPYSDPQNRSDTRIVAESLFEKLTQDYVTLARDKLEDILGNNKFAMLYNNGEYVILNEDDGHWENGIWFSNSYSCNVVPANKTRRDELLAKV